jgi:hypothetical protein
MPLQNFHPAVARWFAQQFQQPTAPQCAAWPAIASGRHALIAAPTGSGKTLAAFLSAIDALVRQAVRGELPDETQVVYVSPLKALSNDISATSSCRSPASPPNWRRWAWRRRRSAPRCAAAIRRRPNARRCALAAAHPGDHAGVAVPAAHQRVRPQDAGEHPFGDRR